MVFDNKDKEGAAALAALRRAGLRAVVTKALVGGLVAYLCVRERETPRLQSNCLEPGRGLGGSRPAWPPETGCLGGNCLFGARPPLRAHLREQ